MDGIISIRGLPQNGIIVMGNEANISKELKSNCHRFHTAFGIVQKTEFERQRLRQLY
jgi:hypothetical protein